MNRIDHLFQQKRQKVLSIYFSAGYPTMESTVPILEELEQSGADMAEIGIPFSDPLADGPVIQESNNSALKNGMSLTKLFGQLEHVRLSVHMPLLLMGYFNVVMQYGIEKFCKDCKRAGIDGIILPDLPDSVYLEQLKPYVEANDLRFVFLITPQTNNERIHYLDSISNGFLYMVSSSSTTGVKSAIVSNQVEYFERVNSLTLRNPLMIGFGISSKETFLSLFPMRMEPSLEVLLSRCCRKPRIGNPGSGILSDSFCKFTLKMNHMITHIVFWKLKEGAHGLSKMELALSIKAKLEHLNGKIAGMRLLEVGLNINKSSYAFDLALYSTFDTQTALDEYYVHPLHTAVLPYLAESTTDTCSGLFNLTGSF